MHDSFNGSKTRPNNSVISSILNPMGHTSVIQHATQQAASNSNKNYSNSYKP